MAFDRIDGIFLPRQAILKHERRHAMIAQPTRDIVAFMRRPEFAMASAGCDHDATNAELAALADDQRSARTAGIMAK